MPTNVTREYLEAEEELRAARNSREKLEALKKMLKTVPKHKGTEKLQMQIKRKISKLKEDVREGRRRGGGPSFNIKKEGAAQVALIGLPNSGKSLLLNRLTHANTEVGTWEFTTVVPQPGMMEYEDIQIQLVEIPALIEGAFKGKGLGGKIFSAIRVVDALLIVIDLSRDPLHQMKIILRELERANVKVNSKRKDVEIVKKSRGGIEIRGKRYFKGDIKTLKEVLLEEKIHNALVIFKERTTIEEFSDVLNEALVHLDALVLANKADLLGSKKNYEKLLKEFPNFEIIPISALTEWNLKIVREKTFKVLEIIRIHTKTPGSKAAYPPITLKKGATVMQVAERIHRHFTRDFKFAKVWGTSAKYDGQRVGGEHILEDEDTVEVHLR
ncbi:MAG: GTPase [Candidatus Methanofastidiosia archaeon]